jgi:two-component sensor histidine kinase
LNLQKRRSKNKESIDLILSLQNRIQTIALVHNNLFQSDEMEFVQLEPYVRTLVQHLQQMYVMDEKQEIAIQFSMDPNIYLRFERIGTLGLIINEIVSNAFKYAFLEGPGVLRIDVQQVEGEVKMEIEDNGSGKVEEIQKNSNLGMRLISILSEQMGAQYVLQQSNGIKHLINFDV